MQWAVWVLSKYTNLISYFPEYPEFYLTRSRCLWPQTPTQRPNFRRTKSLKVTQKIPLISKYTKNEVKIVKLRRGSGKDRQGMAAKAKGLKA